MLLVNGLFPLETDENIFESNNKKKRLNHLMILLVHKDRTDKIDLGDVANQFVEWKDNRVHIFGAFFTSSYR